MSGRSSTVKGVSAIWVVACIAVVASTAAGEPTPLHAARCSLGAPRATAVGSFAPSAARLVVAQRVGSGARLSVFDLNGRRIRNVGSRLAGIPTGIAWSPRNSAIAYALRDELHVTGAADHLLLNGRGAMHLAGWTTDGSALLVAAGAPPSSEILLVQAKTGQIDDLGIGWSPSLAPDGHKAAVVAPAGSPGASAVEVIDLATNVRTRIYVAGTPVIATAFSPDSRQVAFLDNMDVEPRLIAQMADGSSTGTFGRDHGALYRETALLPPLAWTPRGIIGNGILGDQEGVGVSIYNPARNGYPHLLGIPGQIDTQIAAVSTDGRIAYIASPTTLDRPAADGGLRLNALHSADRPLAVCRVASGAKIVRGTVLNDVIDTRDRTPDRVICGGGTDLVFADRRDTVGRTCESVVRHR